MSPDVTIVAGGERRALQSDYDDEEIVPAGPVALEIDGVKSAARVRLDGRAVDASVSGGRLTLLADLTRDTGFHELAVGTDRFVFGTEDAKLAIDGMLALLDYLGQHGLSWSGTMYFTGQRAVLRDLRLDRAWIEQTLPDILSIGNEIARHPATLRGSRRRRATHGVPDLSSTLRLLRKQRDLLEELWGGPVSYEHADGVIKTYAPREVIVRERVRVLDTPGNRRATALIDGVAALLRRVIDAAPKHTRAPMNAAHVELERLLLREPFRGLHRRRAHVRLFAAPGTEELFDDRYVAISSLHRELFADRHWDPAREVLPERAFAGHSDQIYQRFCAHLLADHLGLSISDDGLDSEGPHFTSNDWQLWVDVTPPASVIKDWRDDSTRPANLRPDLVLRNIPTDRVAILDAKYRADGPRASSSSLRDVQLYLQAYRRATAGVLYPPATSSSSLATAEVTDGTYSIFEIPFVPWPEMGAFLETAVDPVLDRLLEPGA